MSPQSRRRKPKSNSADKRDRRRQQSRGPAPPESADEPGQVCDCVFCRGQDDEFDPDVLITEILEIAAPMVDSQDPLEAEMAATALLASTGLAGPLDEDLVHMLTDEFVPALEAHARSEALAMLAAFGAIAPAGLDAAARAAADRLADRGIARPGWADKLGTPLSVETCRRWVDPDETGSMLLAEFTRAGARHALLVGVDYLDCGAASDITLLDAEGIPEAERLLHDSLPPTGGGPAGADTELVEETLDPAEWRRQAEAALDIRADHNHDEADLGLDDLADELDWLPDEEDEDEEDDDPLHYPAMALLLRSRLAVMPVSETPKRGHDEATPDALLDGISALAGALGHLGRLTGGAPGGGNRISPAGRIRPAPLLPDRAETDAPETIYQVKATLRGAKPPIWRRLQLPDETSLQDLHKILQVAFDWDDDHLHLFDTPYGEFAPAGTGLDAFDETLATLEQIVPETGEKLDYTYDFGDDWRLQITVEKLLDPDPGTEYPRCTGGRRAAPPEDCGGISGYAELTEALMGATGLSRRADSGPIAAGG